MITEKDKTPDQYGSGDSQLHEKHPNHPNQSFTVASDVNYNLTKIRKRNMQHHNARDKNLQVSAKIVGAKSPNGNSNKKKLKRKKEKVRVANEPNDSNDNESSFLSKKGIPYVSERVQQSHVVQMKDLSNTSVYENKLINVVEDNVHDNQSKSELNNQQQHDNNEGVNEVWRVQLNVPFSEDYVANTLRSIEEGFYKAAGILPITILPENRGGGLAMLVGKELRKGEMGWGHFAGKREDYDIGSAATAWRETWEESGKVLSMQARNHFVSNAREGKLRVIWIKHAKQAVYMYKVPTEWGDDLIQIFNSNVPRKKSDFSTDEKNPTNELKFDVSKPKSSNFAHATTEVGEEFPNSIKSNTVLVPNFGQTKLVQLKWLPLQELKSGNKQLGYMLRKLSSRTAFMDEMKSWE